MEVNEPCRGLCLYHQLAGQVRSLAVDGAGDLLYAKPSANTLCGSVANGQASDICLQLGHRAIAVPVIGPHKGPELAEKTGRITPHTTTNLEHVSHGLAGTSFDLVSLVLAVRFSASAAAFGGRK